MPGTRKIIIAFLKSAIYWLAINSVAQSQQNITRPDQFRAVYWGIEDGLPWNIGNVIIKDARGFLWIGNGYRGLSRFDGAFFKKYLPVNLEPDEINSDGIHSFLEDSLNNIWIGTNNGLSRYDIRADTFTNFVSPVSPDNPDRSILPFWANSNYVYCVESKRRVIEYDIRSFKSKSLVTFSDNESRHIRNNENTVLDTVSNCIWTLGHVSSANEQGSLLQISLKDNISTYYQWPCTRGNLIHRHLAEAMRYDAKRNSIWVNSGDGLFRFALDEKKFYQIEAMNELTKLTDYDHGVAIELDKYGRIWLATKPRGVFVYDPETELVMPIFSNKELQGKTSESIHHIYEDRNGIVWFTYWGGEGGLYEILPFNPPIKQYTANPKKQDSLSSGMISTIVPGPEGRLWIGTEDGINIFDPHHEKFEVLREKDLPGIEGKLILPLHIDTINEKALLSAGSPTKIWNLPTYEMDLKTRECKPIVFRDGSKQVNDYTIVPVFVTPYKNGVLVPNERHGIYEIKPGSLFADLLIPYQGEIGRLYAVEDRYVFIQAGGGRLNVTFENKNGEWMRTPHPFDSLNWTYIVYNEKDKSHWVGLPYQLIHFDKDFRKLRAYTEEDGFNGATFSMLFDNSGNLWFNNVVKQISRLNIANGVLNLLSVADGYKSRVFDWFDPGAKDGRGNIYFGTKTQGTATGGLIVIHPENYSSAVTSSVYFRSLLINQKPPALSAGLSALEKLSLRYNQNTIAIETGIIDFYSKGKSRIRYKLERNGKDEGWQYAPANYNIQYEGLPPGTYRLMLQASNAANEFNSPEKILMFSISPPFWQTWWFRILAGIAIITIIYAIVQYRSRSLRKQNVQLEEKIMTRTKELKHSLEDLRETQEQLIQREKMASLGELTAGIAHEIQNPLNFVNNFSEVNTELIAELKDEAEKGNIDEVKEIAQDIGENEKKIMHHGKRADAIIKGMLQHSRATAGQKEPTDFNDLVDEYLRLSYHGFRAKDQSFNAQLNTDFDPSLSAGDSAGNKINIIPQDIGRVVLNLFTNAFYSLNDKKKRLGDSFEPALFVSTTRLNNKLELHVRDNGNGIPERIMNKIFQPFFTTKPTGEGTGLGLSLSYDIITKAHGGELKVETKEGEYAEFVVLLPVK